MRVTLFAKTVYRNAPIHWRIICDVIYVVALRLVVSYFCLTGGLTDVDNHDHCPRGALAECIMIAVSDLDADVHNEQIHLRALLLTNQLAGAVEARPRFDYCKGSPGRWDLPAGYKAFQNPPL